MPTPKDNQTVYPTVCPVIIKWCSKFKRVCVCVGMMCYTQTCEFRMLSEDIVGLQSRGMSGQRASTRRNGDGIHSK